MNAMSDADFMTIALELARMGEGSVHPNPLVGAVLVRDGEIIGRGYHASFGAPHAEIMALEDAKQAGHDPVGATLYVTLEPCCHHGKTPPCTDAIIAAGIRRCVFAMEDPNPVVTGRGASMLRQADIDVASGVAESEAGILNEAFIRFHKTGLPFLTWKLAQTLDGALTLAEGTRSRISSEETDRQVDSMRAHADAVIVGSGTVLIDDPGLRVRSGEGRDPWRVVFDTRLRIPDSARLITGNSDRKTLIICGDSAPDRSLDAEIIRVPVRDGHIDLRVALSVLAGRGFLSVLLESGRTLGNSLLREHLIQRMSIFTAPCSSISVAPQNCRVSSHEMSGGDLHVVIDIYSEESLSPAHATEKSR